jgi:antitoxin component YwqK of YwqJK toxin-antitoxin module
MGSLNKKRVYFLTAITFYIFSAVYAQEEKEKTYYPNGKLESTGTLINGKKNGTWVYYFENGNVSRKINFKDDLEDGLVKTFFPDNKRNEEIFYSNGNVDSLYRFYRTGKMKERTYYSSNRKDRNTFLFDSLGNGKTEYIFKNGRFIKSQ